MCSNNSESTEDTVKFSDTLLEFCKENYPDSKYVFVSGNTIQSSQVDDSAVIRYIDNDYNMQEAIYSVITANDDNKHIINLTLAETISRRSKDINKVGATVITTNGLVAGHGYNGANRYCNDNDIAYDVNRSFKQYTITNRHSWEHILSTSNLTPFSSQKYPFIIHAEINAILNCNVGASGLVGATLYVTHIPCSNCAKVIAQAGIKTVFTGGKIHSAWTKDIHETLWTFQSAGVNMFVLQNLR